MAKTLLDILPAGNQPLSFNQIAVVCMVILTILYVVFRPALKKKNLLDSGPKPRMGLSRQRDVEKQMETLLVELSNMARQISAQLDTRAAKLETLIEDADRRIAQLDALRGATVAPPSGNGLHEQEKPMTARPITVDPRHAEVYGLADQGRSPQEISRELGRPSGEIELILALRPRA